MLMCVLFSGPLLAVLGRIWICWCAGESPERAAQQAHGIQSEMRRMPSGPPAGMHLISPEEITLGALIGEGGFGKVRSSA